MRLVTSGPEDLISPGTGNGAARGKGKRRTAPPTEHCDPWSFHALAASGMSSPSQPDERPSNACLLASTVTDERLDETNSARAPHARSGALGRTAQTNVIRAFSPGDLGLKPRVESWLHDRSRPLSVWCVAGTSSLEPQSSHRHRRFAPPPPAFDHTCRAFAALAGRSLCLRDIVECGTTDPIQLVRIQPLSAAPSSRVQQALNDRPLHMYHGGVTHEMTCFRRAAQQRFSSSPPRASPHAWRSRRAPSVLRNSSRRAAAEHRELLRQRSRCISATPGGHVFATRRN
ncbi:hypothetical protein EDC01DRAFT_477961 [Geopyxis carbonaria]|nr:hypothetical protein EDC01DRAFT_477961 [Geopyxis carbonaria]